MIAEPVMDKLFLIERKTPYKHKVYYNESFDFKGTQAIQIKNTLYAIRLHNEKIFHCYTQRLINGPIDSVEL